MSSPSVSKVDTLEVRLRWAIKNRRVYVFSDNDKIGIVPKPIDGNDDDDDIRYAQKSFEKKYTERKHELEEEEEKERRREAERKLEEEKKKAEKDFANQQLKELFDKYPSLKEEHSVSGGKPKLKPKPVVVLPHPVSRPVAGPSKRTRISIENDDDDDDAELPAPKRAKTVELKGTPGGRIYDESCKACEHSGHECREQIPKKTICYRCAAGRIKCSLKAGPKYGRSTNRGKIVSCKVDTDIEVESEDEVKEVPRRSLRGSNDITCNDVKALIESIDKLTRACHTTLKDIVASSKTQVENQMYLNEKVNSMQVDFRKVVDRMRCEDGEIELGWRGTGSKSKKRETSALLLGEMKKRKVDQFEITKESIEKAVSEGLDVLLEGIETAQNEERRLEERIKGKGKEKEKDSDESESESEEGENKEPIVLQYE